MNKKIVDKNSTMCKRVHTLIVRTRHPSGLECKQNMPLFRTHPLKTVHQHSDASLRYWHRWGSLAERQERFMVLPCVPPHTTAAGARFVSV